MFSINSSEKLIQFIDLIVVVVPGVGGQEGLKGEIHVEGNWSGSTLLPLSSRFHSHVAHLGRGFYLDHPTCLSAAPSLEMIITLARTSVRPALSSSEIS